MPRQRGPKKAASVEVTLPCTLEELFSGKTKNMRITRNVTDSSGRTQQEQEVITIDVKPGWKKGTRITFPEKGGPRCCCCW